MNANFKNGQLPGSSPLANVLVVVVGAIAITVSFIIGVVAFVALAAAVLILGAIIGIRIWWLGVKSRKHPGGRPASGQAAKPQSNTNAFIEGEFHEVSGGKSGKQPPQT